MRARMGSARGVRRRGLRLLLLLLLPGPWLGGGCGDDDGGAPGDPLCEGGTSAALGLRVGTACPAGLRLLPRARLEGQWRGGGADGACTVDGDDAVSCPAGDAGTVTVTRSGAVLGARFAATRDVVLEGVELTGRGHLPGATSWLSNGFQSWSQSGVVALGPEPTAGELDDAIALLGDAEVLREGRELSWSFSWVGGGDVTLVAGALSAARLRPWVQAFDAGGGEVGVRLVSGAAGERIALAAGESVEGEAFHVELAADAHAAIERWSDALESRARTRGGASPELGWNSWYELWDGVDEQAVRDNAARAVELLGPLAGDGRALRIVVDDGWQVRWGEWEPNEKFPSGLDGLARDLRSQGLRMGVWLAPLLVAADSALVSEHPDWFVGGASYVHAKNGEMRILDVTHPDAAAHLAEVIGRIVGWGYDLLKIDFLFAGTFEGTRREAVTGMEAYSRALAIVREAAGEDTLLLAVGAPDVASLPFADGWRAGPDIALEPLGPSWPFVTNEARALGARWPICRVTACDGDPPLLRQLPRNEVDAGAWVAAFAGGAFFLSDDLRALEPERVSWGVDDARVAAALSGVPAVPEDLFPAAPPDSLVNAVADHFRRNHTSTHVLPRVWRLPDGGRVLLHAGDDEATIDGTTVAARSAVLVR